MGATGKARKQASQALVEFVALALVVFAAILAMKGFINRATAGRLKENVASISGDFYFDPGNVPKVTAQRASYDYFMEGFKVVDEDKPEEKAFLSDSNGWETMNRSNVPENAP